MVIDTTGFSVFQQKAIFDLLILAVYADGHVTNIKDEQLGQLLTAMGCAEEIDRQREFDAAVTRMRPAVQSIWNAKEQAVLLAEPFTERNQRKQVFAAVEQIMSADNHISTWENVLLMELRMRFRL